jgi:hypothetical protein
VQSFLIFIKVCLNQTFCLLLDCTADFAADCAFTYFCGVGAADFLAVKASFFATDFWSRFFPDCGAGFKAGF